MYETLEHWKQYKQEEDLQTKIAKEFKLNKLEINATCGCLLHWAQVDLEEGRIDSIAFESYTWNIKNIKLRNNE